MGNYLRVKKGQRAGWCDKDGYWRFRVDGKVKQVNRLIWEIHYGEATGLIIDHIDGNPSNNKLSNLRAVSLKTNAENQRKYKNNTSGVCGVKWQVPPTRNPYNKTYAVAVYHNSEGRKKSKSFSVSTYGLLPAFHMACVWREKMIKLLNSNGANYTDRHGK